MRDVQELYHFGRCVSNMGHGAAAQSAIMNLMVGSALVLACGHSGCKTSHWEIGHVDLYSQGGGSDVAVVFASQAL